MTITTKKVVERSIDVDELLEIMEDAVSCCEKNGNAVTTVDIKLLGDAAMVIRELLKENKQECYCNKKQPNSEEDLRAYFETFLTRSYR